MQSLEGERTRARYREYLVTIHDQSGNDTVKWCTEKEAIAAAKMYGGEVSITGPTIIPIQMKGSDPNEYSIDE